MGMKEAEMELIAGWIDDVCRHIEDIDETAGHVRGAIADPWPSSPSPASPTTTIRDRPVTAGDGGHTEFSRGMGGEVALQRRFLLGKSGQPLQESDRCRGCEARPTRQLEAEFVGLEFLVLRVALFQETGGQRGHGRRQGIGRQLGSPEPAEQGRRLVSFDRVPENDVPHFMGQNEGQLIFIPRTELDQGLGR